MEEKKKRKEIFKKGSGGVGREERKGRVGGVGED